MLGPIRIILINNQNERCEGCILSMKHMLHDLNLASFFAHHPMGLWAIFSAFQGKICKLPYSGRVGGAEQEHFSKPKATHDQT